jgi:hypothetical protein
MKEIKAIAQPFMKDNVLRARRQPETFEDLHESCLDRGRPRRAGARSAPVGTGAFFVPGARQPR